MEKPLFDFSSKKDAIVAEKMLESISIPPNKMTVTHTTETKKTK